MPPRRGRAARGLAVALLAAALCTGCVAPRGPTPYETLRAAIQSGDLGAADALIARHAGVLDDARALDLSIRAGSVEALRHYVARTGPDVALDLDGTPPLVRAVLDAPAPARAPLVAALLEAGARLELPDRYGRDARAYATVRNRLDLVALMDAAAGIEKPASPPAFAAWLGASAAAPAPAPDAASGAPAASSSGAARANPAAANGSRLAPANAAGSDTGRVDPRRAPASSTRAGAGPDGTAVPGTRGAVPKPNASGAAARGTRATAPAPVAARLDVSLLLRQSPWLPAIAGEASGAEVAALRFHADGVADVLRHRVGSDRFEPMPKSWAAWQLEGERLRIAIAGEAFSVGCVGVLAPAVVAAPVPAAAPATKSAKAPASAPGAARSRSRTAAATAPPPAAPRPTLALACREALPPGLQRAAASLDVAWAMLASVDPPPSPPSLIAIAAGRASLVGDPGAGTTEPRVPSLAVTLAGAPPTAACRPGKARPRVARPSARTQGDWHALDVGRLESSAPLSGRVCPQPQAQDAAMRACREGAGPGRARTCRSVGGCPAGQTSALAGLAGVEAGWIGCDADPSAARAKALAACRADLGCDCQLIALSGRNTRVATAGESCSSTPARRR